jgi:4-diphosphocytidyl-2C-methyl-D-erythritol kinase
MTDNPRIERLPDGCLKICAHAKLNLGLRVFPARVDGFHNLETWMVPISWHDTLWVSGEGALRLEVTGRSEGVPVEIEKNLVGRAAVKLAAAAGMEARGVIRLHKVLPPGGGIGGGSSDAASALLALNEAWGLRWEIQRLEEIAGSLGSDIPFFVRGKASLCTGRGEIMTPLMNRQPFFAVLLIPAGGCPTKEVYQAFDAGHQHGLARAGKTDWEVCARASAEELSTMLVNDLEPGAFFVAPWLEGLRSEAEKVIGRRVHLTGSGSTLFVLCGSGVEAGEIAEKLEGKVECACVPVEVLR